MVGSAICRRLEELGYHNLVTATRDELDLLDGHAVADFYATQRPHVVVIAAARVGGIQANIDSPGEFLYENLQIQNNLIHHAMTHQLEKVCFLGSSCIYPRECPQPMPESALLTGPLEPTNEGYALAKIAGLKLCEFYGKQYGLRSISLMPCNLYGRNDSFDPRRSHVLSALVRRFVDAHEQALPHVTLWGDGSARREFLNVSDFARIAVSLLENYDDPQIINIGSGSDVSIRELATLIASRVGYCGDILWDPTKPNGMPRKCLDVSKLDALGLRAEISLESGIDEVIEEYRSCRAVGAST